MSIYKSQITFTHRLSSQLLYIVYVIEIYVQHVHTYILVCECGWCECVSVDAYLLFPSCVSPYPPQWGC